METELAGERAQRRRLEQDRWTWARELGERHGKIAELRAQLDKKAQEEKARREANQRRWEAEGNGKGKGKGNGKNNGT